MKKLTVVFVVVVMALGIAAPASAHTGAIEITCQGVTYTYVRFPANSTTDSHEIVAVDGVTVHDDTFSFSGASAEHFVPLTISGNALVTASFDFTSSDGFTSAGSDEAELSCGGATTGGTTGGTTTGGTTGGTTTGGTTTGGTTGGTTTGGTTGTTTGGATTGTTTGGTAGGTTTGGTTTGGTTGGTTTGGTTGGTTTGGATTGTTTGGTTSGDIFGGGTTGGAAGAETGGELPFTGLPIWLPLALAASLVVGGAFLLRRGRDEVS
jgi:hypothetical protein